MDKEKKPVVPQQKTFEELNDDELNQVSGGMNMIAASLQRNVLNPSSAAGNIANIQGQQYRIDRMSLGRALEKPSCFTKSDDRLP